MSLMDKLKSIFSGGSPDTADAHAGHDRGAPSLGARPLARAGHAAPACGRPGRDAGIGGGRHHARLTRGRISDRAVGVVAADCRSEVCGLDSIRKTCVCRRRGGRLRRGASLRAGGQRDGRAGTDCDAAHDGDVPTLPVPTATTPTVPVPSLPTPTVSVPTLPPPPPPPTTTTAPPPPPTVLAPVTTSAAPDPSRTGAAAPAADDHHDTHRRLARSDRRDGNAALERLRQLQFVGRANFERSDRDRQPALGVANAGA